jgi:chromosomal replication initiator protein
LIQEAIQANNLGSVRIVFRPEAERRGNAEGTTAAVPVQKTLDFDAVYNLLNPKYTFERFVVGSCNQFAHAASLAVAESPSRTYNPLFIYGGVGLGKTHLMQAVGHRVKSKDQRARLSYVSSEKFTNEVINAIRYDKTLALREKYRNVDVLLIDDIQFISGKQATQEEFFHTFNDLYDAQKQIVLSSDSLPKEIPDIQERLQSRFESGLIADIQPPDLETKVAILKKKAEFERFELPDNVSFYIASKIKSNIRELEGSMVRLMAFSSIRGEKVNLSMAQEVLKHTLRSQEKHISIEQIQKRVADYFNLKIPEIKSKNNSKIIAQPRQIGMYLCRQLTTASLPEIGRNFGGKHHTTVLHSITKVERLMNSNKDFNNLVTMFLESFQ